MRIEGNKVILTVSETKRWYGQDLRGHELPEGADGKLHALGQAMARALANHLGTVVFILPFDYRNYKGKYEGALDSFSPNEKK